MKQMKRRASILFLTFCIALFGLTGCGAAGSSSSNKAYENAVNGIQSDSIAEGNGFNAYGYGGESNDDIKSDMESVETSEDSADTNEQGAKEDTKKPTDNTIYQDKLIYSCRMEIDTIQYDQSIKKLRELINKFNGFLESELETDNAEDIYYDESGRYRNEVQKVAKHYTYEAKIRIPSKNYNQFLDATGDVGDIRSKNATVDNVSTEYYDLQAELTVLNTKYDRYIELMKKAKDVKEILQIEQSLSSTETQINQIKTRLNRYDNDVAYSYIYVNITQVEEYAPKEKESFLSEWGRAIKDSLSGFKGFLQGVILFFTYALPYLLLFGIIIFVVVYLIFRAEKKKVKVIRERVATRAKEDTQSDVPTPDTPADGERDETHSDQKEAEEPSKPKNGQE